MWLQVASSLISNWLGFYILLCFVSRPHRNSVQVFVLWRLHFVCLYECKRRLILKRRLQIAANKKYIEYTAYSTMLLYSTVSFLKECHFQSHKILPIQTLPPLSGYSHPSPQPEPLWEDWAKFVTHLWSNENLTPPIQLRNLPPPPHLPNWYMWTFWLWT